MKTKMNVSHSNAGFGVAVRGMFGSLALCLILSPAALFAQTLQHRYSFASDASDSVGTANGTVVAPSGGTAATISSGLTLPGGGGGGYSGYLSLPSGILTTTTNLTIECWVTQNGANEWGTIWDFGNNGNQNFELCPLPGRNNGDMIVAFTPNGNEVDMFTPISFPNGSEEYVTLTYNNSTLTAQLYYNGALNGTESLPNTTYAPGQFGGAGGTLDNWLGRDVYNDGQFQGVIYEFRIWNGVISQRQIAASAILGSATLVTNLTPTAVAVSAGTNLILTGTESASVTVELLQTGTNLLAATADATSWSSSNPSVLAVSTNGVISGVGIGNATISAKVGGTTGTTAPIYVTGPQTLLHRYSFVSDATDSVGGANGTLVAPTAGAAATISNGLILPGNETGGFGYSGYVSLPSGILTNTTSLTIDCWVTQTQGNTWSELWDFGNNGNQNFGLITDPANNGTHMEVAFTPNGSEIDVQSAVPFPNGTEQYVCLSYNNFTLTGNLYTNGQLVATTTFPNGTYCPGSIGGAGGTTENMLGNDVYGDWQFSGTVYEFRIWNGALSSIYAAVASAAGPGVVVTNLTPISVMVNVSSTNLIGAQTEQAAVVGNFASASGVTVTGGATNWTSSNPGVLTVSTSGLITAISGGTATVSATVNGVSATSATIFVATTRPQLTQTPVNVTIVVGQSATFGAQAIGGGLNYAWSFNSSPISGATNSTYTVSNAVLANAGTYTVQVSNNQGSTNASATLAVLSQYLLHRYSFVSDASDSVGGANGTLVAPNGGAAATINNGLNLPGNQNGGFGYSGYVSLPPGLLTNTSSLTVECWVTQNQQNTWAELWDFGSSSTVNFGLIPFPANNGGNMEVAFTPHGNEVDMQSGLSFPNGLEEYVAVTFNSSTLAGDLYTNGQLLAAQSFPDATYTPGTFGGATGTQENMLGNDVYGDDQFGGIIYEFRIWDGVVSPIYLAISAAAGPSVVVTNLTPTAVTVTVTNSTMIPGQSQPASVTANFQNASGIPVTSSATNWMSSATNVLTVNSSGIVTAVNTGTATISATVNGTTGTSASISVPASAPTITGGPAASETLLVGATLSASVQTIGTPPLVYRWYYNSGATPISISTNNSSLIIPNVQLASSGTYDVVVSNSSGTAQSSNLVLSVISPNTYEQAMLSSGPISLWPLNETSGTTAYDVIGGQNGTYMGGYTLGQPGPTNAFFDTNLAAAFDGASAYVDIPGALFNTTGAVTVVAWVQLTSLPGFGDAIGHGDPSWRISVNNTGEPGASDGSVAADATSPNTIFDTKWHMLAYTYSGVPGANDNGSLYVDGALVANNQIPAAPAGDSLDVWIGGAPDYGTAGTARLLPALIADAAVWDEALSASELLDLYNGSFVPSNVTLTITKSGSNVVLTWPGGTLLEATHVTGPWTTNSAALSPYTNAVSGGSQFFRILVGH